MEVSWSPLSYEDITHYTVYYSPTSSKQSNFTTTNTSVVIGGLLPEETYIVQVSASTAAGEGVRSEEAFVKLIQSSGECKYCT